MQSRRYLLKIQKEMHAKVRHYAERFLGHGDPSLRQYRRTYENSTMGPISVSSQGRLLQALCTAQIALLGDYHTLSSAQNAALDLFDKLIHRLRGQGRSLVLALEMLDQDAESAVDRFLKGEVSEANFLKEIRYRKRWGFDWQNYKPLFDFVRSNHLKIVGLNTSKQRTSLPARDRVAAQRLVEVAKLEPQSLVIGLMGDFHLAPPHLPGKLRELGCEKLVVVHQNIDPLHFDVIGSGLEALVDVVEIGRDSFCILNAPPWLKVQSEIEWSEREDPISFWEEEVHEFIKLQQEFFGVRLSTEITLSIERDEALFDALSHLSPKEKRFVARSYSVFPALFVSPLDLAVMRELSAMNAAEVSGIAIHAKASGYRRVFQSPVVDFYSSLLSRAAGFVASKVIYPSRTARKEMEVLGWVHSSGPLGRSAEIALAHQSILSRRGIDLKTEYARFPKRPSVEDCVAFYGSSIILGEWLGSSIYDRVQSGLFSREQLSEWMSERVEDPKRSKEIYLKTLALVGTHR